jgi:hypothetical protein
MNGKSRPKVNARRFVILIRILDICCIYWNMKYLKYEIFD